MAPIHRNAGRIVLADPQYTLAASRAPIQKGASLYYGAVVNKSAAERAVSRGFMDVLLPSAEPLRLTFERTETHPGGNWTWIGRGPRGESAVITFGPTATFGLIPRQRGTPLRLTTEQGRTWMVDVAVALAPHRPEASSDTIGIPTPATQATRQFGGAPIALSTPAVVDVMVAYTLGFAGLHGGSRNAVTRIWYLADLANQSYANSQVPHRIRVARIQPTLLPDNGANPDMLNYLAFGNGQASVLLPERNQFGADLVILMRRSSQDHQNCGAGFIMGYGVTGIVPGPGGYSQQLGYSVADDGNCLEITFAHELGHNMGLQHDRVTASQTGVLEYGATPASFGYRNTFSDGGFHTVMAYPTGVQQSVLGFSNPNTWCTFSPCGTPYDNNAEALNWTMPVVATFRNRRPPARTDFDGDGLSDVFWRNSLTGANAIWLAGQSTAFRPVATVGVTWTLVGTADFDGDTQGDLLWRDGNGRNVVWLAASTRNTWELQSAASAWKVAAIGDFDGDALSDIFWRNTVTGANTIWFAGMVAVRLTPVPSQQWQVAGAGDFDGDGRADVLWRHRGTGANVVWRGGNPAAAAVLETAAPSWGVAAVGDFDADGVDDVFWRNTTSGANVVWWRGSARSTTALTTVSDRAWSVVWLGTRGGGLLDVLWRNAVNGRNVWWRLFQPSVPEPYVTPPVANAWRVIQ